ncbi:MAG: DUF1646 domain-containing protein [Desulfurococcales archaeon]|nr:DUF1646 domain-containing protein [Desulfurococcales archaeon]
MSGAEAINATSPTHIPMSIPQNPEPHVMALLLTVLLLVLVLPFVYKVIEENLEPFFLTMGIITVAGLYTMGIISAEGVKELAKIAMKTPVFISGVPIGITQVVLIAGLVFYYFHEQIYGGIRSLYNKLGPFMFGVVFVTFFGLTSSIISVIVTAVILAEVAAALPITRSTRVKFVVIAAFAVGMGAALTPVGEPLSTIAISKLGKHFTYLLDLIGYLIIPGVIAISLLAGKVLSTDKSSAQEFKAEYTETLYTVIMRAVKVYMFVAALELLGNGFTPLVVWYFSKIPGYILYWVNMISAILDNATLTAAEIGPQLTEFQVKSALMGLIISGGMLIPGNIPNIVASGRLKITSKEWARIGVPLGLVLMTVYFIIVEVLKL